MFNPQTISSIIDVLRNKNAIDDRKMLVRTIPMHNQRTYADVESSPPSSFLAGAWSDVDGQGTRRLETTE